MIVCLALSVVVDRVEDDVAVVELGDVLVDVPAPPGLREGDTLRLCRAEAPGAARDAGGAREPGGAPDAEPVAPRVAGVRPPPPPR